MSQVTAIAEVISGGIKYLTLLLKTSTVRRMRKAIESAEKYIQVNEFDGEFKDLPVDKQQKYLSHYRKRFFKYNQ